MFSSKIKLLASIYTVLLLGGLLGLLLFGGFRFKSPQIKGKVINATMVDISDLMPKKDKPKPQNNKPQQKKKPPEIKKTTQKPEKKPPQENKKPPVKEKTPPPVKNDPPKIDTKAQELERKKRLEREKKLEEIRKQRKAAEERRKQEEENLKKLIEQEAEDNKEQAQPQQVVHKKGKSESDKLNELMTRYQLAVISSVERQWNKPASTPEDLLCYVKVRQIPGGGVIDATISSPCNANSNVKKSIIAAIKKADPLPYKGFEKVFARTATFIFGNN